LLDSLLQEIITTMRLALVLAACSCFATIAADAAVTYNSTGKARQKRTPTIALGTIIGAMVTAKSAEGVAGRSGQKGGCGWAGTSPFCDGSCQAHSGLEEISRQSKLSAVERDQLARDSAFRVWAGGLLSKFAIVPALLWDNPVTDHVVRSKRNGALDFGKSCLFGTKALCCRGDNPDDTWRGVWQTSWGETQRCRVTYHPEYTVRSGRCKGVFECADSKGVQSVFVIGHGGNCHKLSNLDGDLEGEAFSGRIIWTGPSQTGEDKQLSRWYYV
jgi:hypothetical protein